MTATLNADTDQCYVSRRPERIQQRRTKGWRKPAGAVSVVRGTPWGNPYMVGVHAATNAEAVALFQAYLRQHPELLAAVRRELRGKTLMCFCKPDEPCHADILLELANPTTERT
jgi:Domain of unknown function (DUF4326)